MYRVLWLEDEVEKVEGFFDKAYQHDIELDHVETLSEFKHKIEANPKYHYDAVILDALGVNESKNEAASLNVLYNAILYLAYHREKEVIPFFVLSGYLGNEEHNNVRNMIGEELIFIKTNDEAKLIQTLKNACESKYIESLKHKYKDIVACFDDSFLGIDNYERMVNLLIYLDSNKTEENAEDRINSIRQILERMFRKLSELNIIPKEIKENKGWINGCSLFLSNKHKAYEHLLNFIDPLVAFNIYHILQVLQDASHDDDNLKLKTVQYLKGLNNDYFYKSCIYSFFDIIIWFKIFIDQNPNPEENCKLWKIVGNIIEESENWVEGFLKEIQPNGFGTFQPNDGSNTIGIHPKEMEKHKFSIGCKIKIITQLAADESKLHITKIIKIN
jgi:hypothetical protein